MKDYVPGTHFYFSLNDISAIFMLLGVNVGTVRLGDGLYFLIDFSRGGSSVAVDVVGIGVRVSAVVARGWFCRRFAIRSIYFFEWS